MLEREGQQRMSDLPDDDPDQSLEPEEVASEGALATAEAFFAALAAGDARAMWDLFSDSARAYIISLGHERGMDFDFASRLRAGTASEAESQDFLSDVLLGIQKDLTGVDFSRLAFESKVEPEAPMQVRVNYLVQVGPQVDELQTAIPAGSILLTLQEEQWKVERLLPISGSQGGQSQVQRGSG